MTLNGLCCGASNVQCPRGAQDARMHAWRAPGLAGKAAGVCLPAKPLPSPRMGHTRSPLVQLLADVAPVAVDVKPVGQLVHVGRLMVELPPAEKVLAGHCWHGEESDAAP